MLVDRQIFVNRVIERVVQVPVQVPVQVHVPVPMPIQVPTEVHVPVPVPWPAMAPASSSAPPVQYNTINVLAIAEAATASTARSAPLAIGPGPPGPLLLEAPPSLTVGPPSAQGSAMGDIEEIEEEPLPQSQKKRKFERLSDWPPEWREKYEQWKAAMKDRRDPGRGRAIWDSWDEGLQHQVFVSSGPERREVIRQWKAERAAWQASAGSQAAERQSHDWHEGARIGEADNPGPQRRSTQPPPSNQPHSGNHAPRVRSLDFQAEGGQRGGRAPPTPPTAGELAKRDVPRPRAPQRPDREPSRRLRSGESQFSTAMRPFRPSRPGSAQGNPSFSSEDGQWTRVQDRRRAPLHRQVARMVDALAALSQELTGLRDFITQSQFRGESVPPTTSARRGRGPPETAPSSRVEPPQIPSAHIPAHPNPWDVLRNERREVQRLQRQRRRRAASEDSAVEQMHPGSTGAGNSGPLGGGAAPRGGREIRAGP